jgi:ketosteroid isomerase-like protein
MPADLQDVLTSWADAERRGDAAALDALLTDEFVGIGPVGFTLPKPGWLARFDGGLRYDTVEVDEVTTLDYGDAAFVVGHQRADGTYKGRPTPPDTRVGFTLVREHGNWRIAAIQYSFIAGAPGAAGAPK